MIPVYFAMQWFWLKWPCIGCYDNYLDDQFDHDASMLVWKQVGGKHYSEYHLNFK